MVVSLKPQKAFLAVSLIFLSFSPSILASEYVPWKSTIPNPSFFNLSLDPPIISSLLKETRLGSKGVFQLGKHFKINLGTPSNFSIQAYHSNQPSKVLFSSKPLLVHSVVLDQGCPHMDRSLERKKKRIF